jgi:hypothetical protein
MFMYTLTYLVPVSLSEYLLRRRPYLGEGPEKAERSLWTVHRSPGRRAGEDPGEGEEKAVWYQQGLLLI